MDYLEVRKAIGREIINSRGSPAVEAKVYLTNDTVGRGTVPSGVSTGEFEALELRDGDKDRFGGRGVSRAVQNINTIIHDTVGGMDASDTYDAGRAIIKADGTEDKSKLGASAILAVSIVAARATSISLGTPPYRFLEGMNGNKTPVPATNVLNDEAHMASTVDVQEFVIMPAGAPGFREGLYWCTEVSHALAALLKEKGPTTPVDNEGGFAPDLTGDEKAIQFILEAVRRTGYEPGKDFMLAMDTTFDEWRSSTKGQYILPRSKKHFFSGEPTAYWKELCEKYPICPIEDGLDEEDWED